MRQVMIAAACVLVTGLAATAQDVKPVPPAQPAVPRVVQPAQPRPVTVTAAKMAQLEEDFELAEAQRDVKKAHVRAAEVAVEAKKGMYEQVAKISGNNLTHDLRIVLFEFDMAKAQLDIRMAELKETEVKLKHAKKRLDDAKAAGVRPAPVDPRPQTSFRDR